METPRGVFGPGSYGDLDRFCVRINGARSEGDECPLEREGGGGMAGG